MQLPAGRETPAPWCNYLNHPGFGTLCCESELLFSYGDNSHLHRLTPWVNDPVTPQGGEYLLSISCTGYVGGEIRAYHRLYDVVGVTVVSDKNTVGFYDMNSKVEIYCGDED